MFNMNKEQLTSRSVRQGGWGNYEKPFVKLGQTQLLFMLTEYVYS